MPNKKTRSLEHFWKMLSREKEKNPLLVYPGVRYTQKKNFACKFFFSKNVCLNTKIILRLKKKHEKFFGRNFKNFCFHQKNASFSFLFSTIHQNLCQNKRKVFLKFDDPILANCMKFVWLVFFHRLSYWNCMISIFGLWRSTRVVSGFRSKDAPFVLLLFFPSLWSFRQNFNMFKDLSLESRNLQTQNCAPIRCTVCPRNEKILFLKSSSNSLMRLNCEEKRAEARMAKWLLRINLVVQIHVFSKLTHHHGWFLKKKQVFSGFCWFENLLKRKD